MEPAEYGKMHFPLFDYYLTEFIISIDLKPITNLRETWALFLKCEMQVCLAVLDNCQIFQIIKLIK